MDVMETIRKKEGELIDRIRLEAKQKQEAVRQQTPYTSWVGCLQYQATQGNETALAILRSKKTMHPALAPTGDLTTPKPEHHPDELATQKPEHRQDEFTQNLRKEIITSHGVSDRHRTFLLTVVKMMQVMDKTEGLKNRNKKIPNFTLDTNGTIIFPVPGGGSVRDTGKEIYFSGQNKLAETLAQGLTQLRWGHQVGFENGTFKQVAIPDMPLPLPQAVSQEPQNISK